MLLSLYGPQSPIDIHLNATQPGLIVALAFVTLPFVVRSVQPVLIEVDREVEEAAASLGRGQLDDLPLRRAAHPGAGHHQRRGARIRPRDRRVRVGRPDRRKHSPRDPGRLPSTFSSRSRSIGRPTRRPCRWLSWPSRS